MDIAKIFGNSLKGSFREAKKTEKVISLIASHVVQAINDDDELNHDPQNAEPDNGQDKNNGTPTKSKIDEMPANKQAYYISLALRDVKSIIDVANFNLNNALKKSKPTVTDVYFDRNGSSQVDVVIPFDYKAGEGSKEDFSEVKGAFDLELRNEYKDLVSYELTLPTVAHPQVSIKLTITIPKALLESIGVGKFNTRTKVLTKYVDNLIKKELI